MKKLTEHEILVTLATMAVKMDDLTGHDVLEAFRELGHGAVIDEAKNGVVIPGVGVPERRRLKKKLPDPATTTYGILIKYWLTVDGGADLVGTEQELQNIAQRIQDAGVMTEIILYTGNDPASREEIEEFLKRDVSQ